MLWIPSQVPKFCTEGRQDPFSKTEAGGWGGLQGSGGAVLSRDVARASVPRGAYRVDEHSAGAGRADREAGAGRIRNVHGAAAVPGGAWACLLRGCGAAAGGGSFERGGSKPPRAVALRTATARDPGRRHLSQDGGRSGPPAEHAAPEAEVPPFGRYLKISVDAHGGGGGGGTRIGLRRASWL